MAWQLRRNLYATTTQTSGFCPIFDKACCTLSTCSAAGSQPGRVGTGSTACRSSASHNVCVAVPGNVCRPAIARVQLT